MRSLSILGLVPLLSSAAFAADAPSVPSASGLSSLVVDYNNTSVELENAMKTVVQTVPYCRSGMDGLSKMFMGRAPGGIFANRMNAATQGQAVIRGRIMSALFASQRAISQQVKGIEATVVAGQNDAGTKAIDAATAMIGPGIDAPVDVIDEELDKATPYIREMNAKYGQALQVLQDSNPTCQQAREAFTQKVHVLSNQMPRKLAAIRAALLERKADLISWSAQVKTQLVTNSGSMASGSATAPGSSTITGPVANNP